LQELLTGKIKIIPTKWKPKKGEVFYTLDFSEDNLIEGYTWNDNVFNNLVYKRNLVFKTKEEAIEKAKIMLEAIEERD